ncbi:MAG: putative 4-hydroxybenzoate polyprenyltransferase [Leptospirales bacterium]|nr:putative 4-hydroxybenzoate polyprenyltransferase [Leptospirales bacterium]
MNIFSKTASKIWAYGELVIFSHTLFSLPFAIIAMLLAADGMPSMKVFIWIIIALFAGRNGANALNRYVDAAIDAKNPRTADRHIPAKKIRRIDALIIALVCFAIFAAAAAQLNKLCLYLSPIAIFLFVLYSYTKRFTWLCHVILGITCACAPLGAWIAVTGQFDYIPFIFLPAVTLWIAGYDIIYGAQDIDFDRAHGLFSIPARFGLEKSLRMAAVFHALAWLIFLSLFFLTGLSYIYLSALIICGILIIFQHYSIGPARKIKANFFAHVNQIVGILLLAASAIDILR